MRDRSGVILEGAERPTCLQLPSATADGGQVGSPKDSIASPRLTWLRSRMTRFINSYIFFIFIWFIFSYPFFFQGKIPAPLDFLVNFFAPWDKYFDSPVKNPAIADVVNQIIPWKTYTSWSLRRGEIPLWNPYNLAGAPYLANWQSGVLYPTNLLFLFLPFTTAWSFHILLQPLLAGLFMILYLKSLSSAKGRSPEGGLSQISALVGALAFSYGGFMTTWLEWGSLGHALVWLPLGLYGVEQGRRPSSRAQAEGTKEEGRRNFQWLLIPFSWTMSLFAGHLQISLYVIATTAAYFIWRTWNIYRFRSILFTVYCLLFTVILASPQFLPSLHLYQHSYRSESLDEDWFKNFRIPIYGFVTFIAPDFFGNPVTRNHWSDHSYVEMMGYVGIVPMIFALLAILKSLKRTVLPVREGQSFSNVRNFFIGVILVSFVLSLKSPISNLLLWLRIPVLSSSSPARIIGIVTFSLAVLAAIGLNELIRNFKKEGFRQLQLPLAIIAAVFLGLWSWAIFSTNPNASVSQRNLIFPTVIFGLMIGIFLMSFRATTRNLYRYRFPIRSGMTTLFVFSFLVLSTLDLFRFHHKFTPFTDPAYFYPEIPVIRWLRDHPGRTFGLFDANLNLPFRIATVEGYDPLVLGDYVRYTSVAETGDVVLPKRTSAVQLPKNGTDTMRILNELGVKYVVQPTVHGAQPWELQLWNYPGQFERVFADTEYEVYENLFAKEPAEPFSYLRAKQAELFKTGVLTSLFTVFGMLIFIVKYKRQSKHSELWQNQI